MHRYKTVVTDYEGMQGILDTHAAQGWRLFSLTPDTWRKSITGDAGMETPPFEDLNAHAQQGTQEYSASYYLLVFTRDETEDRGVQFATAEKALPQSDFALGDE